MVTDPGDIRRLGDAKAAENLDFRRFAKAHHCPEERLHQIAEKVQREIDCTRCANCCHETVVAVSEEEIEAIAAYLGMTCDDIRRLYTMCDPDDSRRRLLLNVHDACTFLDGNLCMIYEARPKPCREFPHAVLRSRSLGGRMASLCRRASLCPIVYNTLESYKHEIGYHPHH